ncbi:hypothetical protein MM817_01709 [Acidibacillus sp. S0AB]|uniref:Uncharacterized protein n=1 Tax=Sulfoacidibacillus ferrooxidans TaxID=2005001 RepID=A0A9X2AEK5_9BACL|nr:hypothetical protein [Sulfoacidibacillus ferrooxidans]
MGFFLLQFAKSSGVILLDDTCEFGKLSIVTLHSIMYTIRSL